MMPSIIKKAWGKFWMLFSGMSPSGRLATRLASLSAPPYYGRKYLTYSPKGYVSPTATISHTDLHLSSLIFIDDRVLIYQDKDGGPVELHEGVHIYRDTIIQTGFGGNLTIGAFTYIQPRCQFTAYKTSIHIGSKVQIAPNCAFYSYDHSFEPEKAIKDQPLKTRGGIVIEDDAWLGVGVIVLQAVTIGRGAIVAAGSVVTKDVPPMTLVAGNPVKIVKKMDIS